MRVFRRLSIKNKLVAILLATSSVALLLMALLIMIGHALNTRGSIEKQLNTLAEIIGSRSTGALTFNDTRTAVENLNALKAKPNVVYAVIKQGNGEVFAEYRVDATLLQKPTLVQRMLGFTDAFVIVVDKAIQLEGENIGEIRIVSNLDELYFDLVRYLTWTVVMLLVCFAVAFTIGSRLQKVISHPILALREGISTVSERKDYSIRIEGSYEDEVGELIQGFNEMLNRIQQRDHKLAQNSANLESEVAMRTAELNKANSQRIRWLETLAKFLRHELKNATVGVKSSLELIDRRTQDHSIDKYTERARKSLTFMNVLLENISTTSNLEASIYKEPLIALNLSELIKSRIQDYHTMYARHSITGACDSRITIQGNENRLMQMLDNLVSNAITCCKEGMPVTISLNKSRSIAELSVINEGDRLPEDKQKIFELFVSMRKASHNQNDHLGLGLYIVKLIAESHGGKVWASDLKDNDGAVFTVSLPLSNGCGKNTGQES